MFLVDHVSRSLLSAMCCPSLKVTLRAAPVILISLSPPLIIRSIVLPFAPHRILARLCIQLKNPQQPCVSEVPGISQCFRGDLEVSRTAFPFPNELIVLEISPASL